MKTRNQLNSKAVTTSDSSNGASNNSDAGVANESSLCSPNSPPRLRDRRLLSSECKSQINSSSNQNRSTSPSSSSTKRVSTGPTRVLPRRSCGRANSLLAETQTTSVSLNSKPCSSISRIPDLNNVKKNTHRSNSEIIPPVPGCTGLSFTEDHELLVTNKTANIRNYSRDVPMTRSTLVSKDPKLDNSSFTKSNKLVRITLPDKTNKSCLGQLANQNKVSVQDMRTYVVTGNGLKKIRLPNEPERTKNDLILEEGSLQKETSNPQSATNEEKDFKLLLGVTGSVATIKLIDLIKKIKSSFPLPYISKSSGTTVKASVSIKVIMTTNSKHFAPKEELVKSLEDPNIIILDDADEWGLWKKISDPVLHIELRKWADLCLIAPLDANTMAKLATGICDNLLTCVVRAWDCSKPLIYCPAMNVHMYNHPITREHFCKLQSFGYLKVDSIEKKLACGDFGMGGMAAIETIANKVVDSLIHPVARKVSISRPLLNQQPTYPIVSTSDIEDQTSSKGLPSVSSQIFNRFRTNNQITIHAVSPRATRSLHSPESYRSESETSSAKTRRIPHIHFSRDYLINNIKYCEKLNLTKTVNNTGCSGSVTSVQNLKAMSSANGELIESYNADDCDDEGMFDFDPSRLLEQTMITDDLNSNEHESKNVPSCNLDDKSATSLDFNVARMGGLTPLFNTSKFLALCHNKERDCFTCTICKHDYKNRKSMARHLKEQHVQGNIYHCKPCGVSYKRREKLIKHNRERHPDKQ